MIMYLRVYIYIYSIYKTKLSIVWEVSFAKQPISVQASAGNVSQHVDEDRHQCRGSNAYRARQLHVG